MIQIFQKVDSSLNIVKRIVTSSLWLSIYSLHVVLVKKHLWINHFVWKCIKRPCFTGVCKKKGFHNFQILKFVFVTLVNLNQEQLSKS